MIIVGENLKSLIKQFNICDESLFDETGINVELGNVFYFPVYKKNAEPIVYGTMNVNGYFEKKIINGGTLDLKPRDSILACSKAPIKMPMGYMGLIQTKGSLARLFVAATCNDAQVDPGFEGKITLEIINYSKFDISIPLGAKVAQIYIIKCSTDNSSPYNGRYQAYSEPTRSFPE